MKEDSAVRIGHKKGYKVWDSCCCNCVGKLVKRSACVSLPSAWLWQEYEEQRVQVLMYHLNCAHS